MKSKITFLIYFFLICAFAYFIYGNRSQLIHIIQVLRHGIWYVLLAVAGLFAAAVYNQGLVYSSIYRLLELPPERRKLSALYLVMRFISVAAPSGGLSGIVPFIQDARRRQLAIGTVLVANLIYIIVWYSTFAVILMLGLLHLFISHDLEWFEIVEAAILLLFDAILITGLFLAWTSPAKLLRILHFASRLATRTAAVFKRPSPLTETHADELAQDLTRAIELIQRAGWRAALRPFGYAGIHECLSLLILFFVAYAFGVTLSFGVLVASYSVGVLFFLISPTPGGLGFVEGVLIVVLTTLGVPHDNATVITLAYRGFTFWLPFVLGFVALRWLRLHTPVVAASDKGTAN